MNDDEQLHEEVTALLRHVSAAVLLPRRRSAAAEAHLKAPGEWVTPADLAVEDALTEALRRLTPGAVIVGEERAASDPTVLGGLESAEMAWLVDPLDGTRHYVDGSDTFGVMLARLERGACTAAWIYLPVPDRLAHARRGAGAWLDGCRMRLAPPPLSARLRGGLLTRFFPQDLRVRAEAATFVERTDAVHKCAAWRYVDILRGEEHLAAYWRTLPWDHVPGVLVIEEAGGWARRFDGTASRPADLGGTGLLVASDEATWERVHRDLRAPLAADGS